MANQDECLYIRRYSALKGLQKGRVLSYSALDTPQGPRLTLSCEREGEDRSAACLCPSLTFAQARAVVLFLYENGAETENWLDLLQDRQILFAPLA